MSESIYSGSNKETTDEPPESMSSFAMYLMPFFAPASPFVRTARPAPANAGRIESATFTHALVALAAKLASVDGTPNTAEYAAFHALFVAGVASQAAPLRSMFVARVADDTSPLQYARQIASMTAGDTALHQDLLSRLLRIATADAAINAAEMELLLAVADVLGVERNTFRAMASQTLVPTGSSAYEILGATPKTSDAELRTLYMNRVQKLHPDRYQAAGASAETIAMLSDQLAVVNAAYQLVQQARAKRNNRSSESNPSSWWSRKNTKGAEVNPT